VVHFGLLIRQPLLAKESLADAVWPYNAPPIPMEILGALSKNRRWEFKIMDHTSPAAEEWALAFLQMLTEEFSAFKHIRH